MKCTLELYGKTYESTEFTERQVSLFLAASAGATGINIKDQFESLMGSQDMPVRGLREYNSLESAEKDLALVLKRVFPTLERSIESIDTSELISIVKPMLFALAGVEEPLSTEPETYSPSEDIYRNVGEPEFPPDQKLLTVDAQIAIDWAYPPGEILLLTPQEEEAIDYASQVSKSEPAKMRCWYAWWQTVNDGEKVSTAVAIEVLMQFTQQFTQQECGRYYALMTAHLEKTALVVA